MIWPRTTEKFFVLVSSYFSGWSESMSSHNSDGESYISHYVPDPKIFGDIYPYLWATDEQEDTDLEKTKDAGSYEDEAPLPRP